MSILGELDDVWIPVSNYELRPLVGALPARPTLVPHDAEVASIVELPLAALFDPDVLGEEEFESRGFRIVAGAYRYGGVRVWGATALTLGMFAHVLEAARGRRLARGSGARCGREARSSSMRAVLRGGRGHDAGAGATNVADPTTARRRCS